MANVCHIDDGMEAAALSSQQFTKHILSKLEAEANERLFILDTIRDLVIKLNEMSPLFIVLRWFAQHDSLKSWFWQVDTPQ